MYKRSMHMWTLMVACLAFLGCGAQPSLLSRHPGVDATFDHIVIMVDNRRAAERLAQGGFIEASALAARHQGRGTASRYYLFLDGYIELQTLTDASAAQLNVARFKSDYVRRWSPRPWECAFGVAFTRIPRMRDGPKSEYETYTPAGDTASTYLMHPNNDDMSRPLVFVPPAGRLYREWGHIGEASNVEAITTGAQLQRFLRHHNGVKRLTQVTFTLPTRPGEPAWIPAVVPGIEVERGRRCMVTLTFDNGVQGKTIYVPTVSPVRIRY
ncbi:MAG: VOC family protein [Myxococcota bacterium]|nr:VOC family protein [Myxococcota bacterium]